jgi:hypothetical protein
MLLFLKAKVVIARQLPEMKIEMLLPCPHAA